MNNNTTCADALQQQAVDYFTPGSFIENRLTDDAQNDALGQQLSEASFTAKLPAVQILAPLEGVTYGSEENLTFEGTSSDAEDGSLSNFSWSSDLGGVIGSDASLSPASLCEGQHTIPLRGIDSNVN